MAKNKQNFSPSSPSQIAEASDDSITGGVSRGGGGLERGDGVMAEIGTENRSGDDHLIADAESTAPFKTESMVSSSTVLQVVVLVTLALLVLVVLPCASCVALVTSPLWLPLALFTSPLWIPLAALAFCIFWLNVAVALALFFFWPREYMPEGRRTESIMQSREWARRKLLVLQARLLLYSAGVGPIADLAIMIAERLPDLEQIRATLDIEKLRAKLQRLDAQQLRELVKSMLSSAVGISL